MASIKSTEELHQANATGISLQASPTAGTLPQASPTAGTLPQASPTAGTLPQASPTAGTLPQASPTAGTLPQAWPTAGTLPQASPTAGTLPQASHIKGILPLASRNPEIVPVPCSSAGTFAKATATGETIFPATIFEQVQRDAFLHVNLDTLGHNVNVLRQCCENQRIGMIGVVKKGGYGHGSILVARHLKFVGVERLAVATLDEAVHLRNHFVKGPIHVFGNVDNSDLEICVKYGLIPTVTKTGTAVRMLMAVKKASSTTEKAFKEYGVELPPGSINIKIDTAMSGDGCKSEDLLDIWQICKKLDVPVDGMFTHFADSWGDRASTLKQLETFQQAIAPYRGFRVNFHVADSGAVLQNIGTDLDFHFIRPGICLYGLPPAVKDKQSGKPFMEDNDDHFRSFGLMPIGSVKARPHATQEVAFGPDGGTLKTGDDKGELVATFAIGHPVKLLRHVMSEPDSAPTEVYVVRDAIGELCPILQCMSRDKIRVGMWSKPAVSMQCSVVSASDCPVTSALSLAHQFGITPYEVIFCLSSRLPRVYETTIQGKLKLVLVKSCTYMAY